MSDDYGMETEQSYGFDLPDDSGSTFGATQVEPQEDDGWGNAFDPEEIEAALRDDLPPEGRYVGHSLTVTDRVNQYSEQREISCYGRATNAEGRVATVRLDLQPKKLYKDDGKLVWNHVLFKQAVAAYNKANGSLPTSAEALKAYLETATLEYDLKHAMSGKGMKTMGVAYSGDDIPF